VLQHPEWVLEEDEQVDWSNFCGTVLDASYNALPNLRPITVTQTFAHLTILCLRESGVVGVELLEPCHRLIHLDLSSNEIVHLANGDFWASFRDLLVLLLHGNKVMEWRAVGGLGALPQLAYLTLFFNPVCKREMYRPFTTNCCESLRGLDLHAVSDEEVVEGVHFFEASRYRTCANALALPQALFKGLTEMAFAPSQQCKPHQDPDSIASQSTSGDVSISRDGHHQVQGAPNRDFLVLSSVLRRVELLRKFHSRNSPVIIGQRQIRRFLRERFGVAAAVKIQTRVRKWFVKLRAISALKDILRESGELYLVQEMMTPTQLRTLTWFQRRIVGHYRLKVLITCAKTLERFMGKVAKRFSALVDSLELAQVGGVIVTEDRSGELASAITRALVVTTPGLTWGEAAERTSTVVTVVSDCRLLRPFSFVRMSDWPLLETDPDTDGVFVTRSVSNAGSRAASGSIGSSVSKRERAAPALRPLSGLREPPPAHRAIPRSGVFATRRVSECKVSRRQCAVRNVCRDSTKAERRAELSAKREESEKLWIFRPLETRTLARVLCTMRNESMGKAPVPFILGRHLSRCASATRIQAIWRAHRVRWVMSDTLASCIIVARAGVCIQRWWRFQRGLASRMKLCRRLWALASAVSRPTMYIELDVYHTLTCGWQWDEIEQGVAFAFQRGDRVAVIRDARDPRIGSVDSKADDGFGVGNGPTGANYHGSITLDNPPTQRELPMWALRRVVRQVPSSELSRGSILSRIGALLTRGVKARTVIWPLRPATVDRAEPADHVDGQDVASYPVHDARHEASPGTSAELSSNANRFKGVRVEDVGSQKHPARPKKRMIVNATGPTVDLRKAHRAGVELLELTFSSTHEARARAVLLALATEEPGVRSNRPVAQLMTYEMLLRAAAGEKGQALPTLEAPEQGYRRGDDVEISVFRLSRGCSGAWFRATVDRRNVYGNTYKVTLENGMAKDSVPESSIRPLDSTGRETALVEMSHLPSRWQRKARSLLTPDDRLELELLRRSLPATAAAELPRRESPMQLLAREPGPEADASVGADELRRFNASDTRRPVQVEPGAVAPGSPPGRGGGRMMSQSPPRWAGSQTMSAVRTAGGLAARALEKVARAAAAADKATAASTWVPGNRFKVGLEKLVHMAAHEAQDSAEKEGLSARREAVAKARHEERAEPSPRDRLEKLKAAEVAIFRRESDEMKNRVALERAMHGDELKASAAEAREYMRSGRKLAAKVLEEELTKQISGIKKWESNVNGERQRKLDARDADVAAAQERAIRRRESRAKQALCVAESAAFTSHASQLARHLGKFTTTSHKTQNVRGMRRWVKDQKIHKEDTRRRMLKRVQELQDEKRREANKVRRALVARGRARAAMDEAVVRHRVGQSIPFGDDFAQDIMHVLRPSSRSDGMRNDRVSAVGRDDGFSESDGGDVDRGDGERTGFPEVTKSQGPVNVNGAEIRRPESNGSIKDSGCDASWGLGRSPSKPREARPRSREHSRCRRRVYGNDAGKTVVVLASVPTVTREAQSMPATAAMLGSRSSQSMTAHSMALGVGPCVTSDQTALPWPLGRRCW
ncbi:unnamed protein product, partial [Scytosiphon promiscuus]